MNININDEALLDLVLQDKLDTSMSVALEERLQDATFNDEYNKTVALREVISEAGRAALKSELSELDQKIQVKQSRTKSVTSLLLAIIALALLWYGWSVYNTPSDIPTEQLYAMHYTPHPNVIDPLTKGDSKLQLTGTQHYELGDYTRAIEILLTSVNDKTDHWYLAQAYIANEQYDMAMPLLSTLVEQNGDYKNESQWFLALIALKKGDHTAAKKLLKIVSKESKNGYGLKAQELLKSL